MPFLSGRVGVRRRPLSRSRRALVVALLGTLLGLTTVVSQPSAPAHAAAPLRLMIAGDSISHEFAGDYTWRYRLRQEFSRQRAYVDFVGPRSGNTGGLPLIPFSDDQHDALGGTLLSTQKDKIGQDVTDYTPDVVLVMMGFNDLNHKHGEARVIDDMDAYLGNLFSARPQTRVILSPVLKNVVYPGTRTRTYFNTDTVNTGYQDLVSKYAGQGRDITMINGAPAARWTPGPSMTVDGVHPTPTGEMVIASRYATALHQIDPPVLPQASGIPLGYVPWVTPARPVVRQLANRRIEFSWDAWTKRLNSYRGQLYIYGGHLTSPLRVYGPYFQSTYTRYLPRGYYGVKLSPSRKWLVARWGPVVHFTVR